MNLIVAVSKNWGIGKDNKLLFSLKEDMKFFKQTTTGKVVVMGKNTYLSLPKRPLKDRVNVVLTKSQFDDGCVTVKDTDELFAEIKKHKADDVFVIGGASLYRQLLPYCDTAYVTKVDADADADAYFENLDNLRGWELVCKAEAQDVLPLAFCIYKNNNVMEYKK